MKRTSLSNYNGLSGLIIGFVCLLIPGISSANCIDEDGRCILGIFPHTSLRQIEATYSTIAEELSLTLDRDIRLSTSSTTEKFEAGLRQGKYDLALVGVGYFLQDHDISAYTPLARRKQNLIYQIISLPGNSLRSLQDIKGKRFGYLSLGNGSSHAIKQILSKENIELKDMQSTLHVSQQACIHALISNLTDACGTANLVKEIFEHELDLKFRVLASSPPLPNTAYIAHKKMGQELVEKARNYFLGREGFVSAKASDYDVYHMQTTE